MEVDALPGPGLHFTVNSLKVMTEHGDVTITVTKEGKVTFSPHAVAHGTPEKGYITRKGSTGLVAYAKGNGTVTGAWGTLCLGDAIYEAIVLELLPLEPA